jgi:hypothetical protein
LTAEAMKKVNRLWGLAALASLGVVSCTIADLKEDESVGGGGSGAGNDSSAGNDSGGGTKTNAEQGGSSHATAGTSGIAGSKTNGGGTGGADTGGTAPVQSAGGEGGMPSNDAAGQGGEAGAGGAASCSPDMNTDPLNCGACDHSCLGGECHDGECAPVVIAKDQLRVAGLAIDDKYAYWANFPGDVNVVGQGQIQRALLAGGGNIEPVASNLTNPAGLIADGSSIYFSNPYCCNATIQKVAKTGGNAVSLATGQSGAQGGVLFGGMIYWPNHVAGGAVMGVSIAGGNAAPVYDNIDRPQWVAADTNNLYWTELEAGFIRKAPRAGGGASTQLASGQPNPCLLTLVGQYLFWANDNNMMRVAINSTGGAAFQAAEGRPGMMASDGKNLFWFGTKGIKMAAASGANVQTLASADEAGGLGSLVIDAKSIVWYDSTNNRVLRKAR